MRTLQEARMKFQIIGISLLMLCAGCTNFPPVKHPKMPPAAAAKPERPRNYWNDEEASGPPEIVISISKQRAYFYKGKTLVGESTVSSGKRGFDTPPGRYKVIQKDKDHASNLYGDYVDDEGNVVRMSVDVTKDPQPAGTTFRGAPMRYFLRFTGGYGMHAGQLPGYRASHGCVRLPREMARHFFENASYGTPVVVEE
jgi:lipoprotein-anchoring transpeptidase ErfK/SrfK